VDKREGHSSGEQCREKDTRPESRRDGVFLPGNRREGKEQKKGTIVREQKTRRLVSIRQEGGRLVQGRVG
jgi:hypothetical protein